MILKKYSNLWGFTIFYYALCALLVLVLGIFYLGFGFYLFVLIFVYFKWDWCLLCLFRNVFIWNISYFEFLLLWYVFIWNIVYFEY